MIRLEVLESPYFIDAGVKRFAGDIFTEENEQKAKAFIAVGWCKNVETGECGERKPGVASLDVQSVKSVIS